MSTRPVFMATHPRACSTAFERVFMTRRDDIKTFHEPFGDAFYYGPERLARRFENDEDARLKSGFSESTFKSVLDHIEHEAGGKRVFIKDMPYYLIPPSQQSSCIAPSLHALKNDIVIQRNPETHTIKRGVGTNGESTGSGEGNLSVDTKFTASDKDSGVEPDRTPSRPPFPYKNTTMETDNPTVIPQEFFDKFHFTFLIRHPKSAIPSYHRCCIPPLVERTQFTKFMPEEAGYDELRRFFDYLKDTGAIGPKVCGQDSSNAVMKPGNVEICVIDADDMLDDPAGILSQYCTSIGLDFTMEMLKWDTEEAHEFAKEQFAKWDGWHDDAIKSRDLKPRQHKKAIKTDEQLHAEWTEQYGQEAADIIKKTVEANVADYEYLKQFAIKKPQKA